MLKLKSILFELPVFHQYREALFANNKLHIKGVRGSALSFVLDYTVELLENNLLAVVPDTEQAEMLADDLQGLLPARQVLYFPQAEVVPYDRGKFAPAIHSTRLNALVSLTENPYSVIITTPVGLMQRIPSPEQIKPQISYLKVGDRIEREFLLEWLVESGFERVPVIEEIGQFSVRGGILDVFSFESDAPYRIEFFDEEIESIREFDVLSQLSVRQVEKIRIVGREFKMEHNATLFDYLKPGSVVFWEDVEHIRKIAEEWMDHARAIQAREGIPAEELSPYLLPEELERRARPFRQIFHVHFRNAKAVDVDFGFQAPPKFQGNFKLFIKHLEKQLGSTAQPGTQMYIVYDKPSRRERLEEIISEEMGRVPPIRFVEGDIHRGFSLPAQRMEILTEHEIFNRLKLRKHRRKLRVTGSLIRQLNSLQYGDYVVHVDYGIGRFVGTERLTVAGVQKDCVKLEYANQDVLYVTLDKLNRIQKYVSEEGYKPQLTRLGSADWERTKERTRRATETIARDLVQLYAKRMSSEGFAFSGDTVWQKELEASFMYPDTPDQIRATREVKEDMELPRPMDRLVCGDVGFGKTEVAIRAAFKAVMDGKQVAVLVPTTILAQQHFHTFRERLRNFPVNIEVLSRFRTPREQRQVLERLQSGDVDIIIGTHRLLSKDVNFKDLGLLIIDEEQQFGVSHKEKLRKLRVNVDTLTLTATPIPRTLQMSLMGARDLSNIDTPPRNRLPIITEIATWDEDLIYKAITYEMERGGQVFFVHNRVQTIEGIAALVKQIVPRARIAIAHGQMKERELERVMNDFYEGKYDVLVSTMIIENGLDLPNCNTIIINRADRFGLAQLYQLRGRVGRSERQAYAYLLIPPTEKLSETAMKRLYAIEEFTDLGSGLKIAMRDLEIRGAGNLLGHQQSGFINAVGFDLYQKILRETVERLQEENLPESLLARKPKLPQVDATVEINADMYLPDEYIPSSNEKVMIYHRLLHLDSLSGIEKLVEEMRDRFGPLPDPARKLVEMVKIKKLASQHFVKQVKIDRNKMILTIDERVGESDFFVEKEIPRYLNQQMAKIQFSQSNGLKIHVPLKGRTIEDMLSFAKNFLQNL